VNTAVGWAPIVKADKQADGTLIVTGKAADSSVDRDHQIADPAWLDKALGQWYGEPDGGNIREQHDGKRAVGRAIEYRKSTDGGHYISAHIVDPVTVTKIETQVLRGFSWSARNARVQVDKTAAGGRIMDGQIYEVSVVDRPANPACLFTIAKADGDGELVDVEDPKLVVTVDKLDTGQLQSRVDDLSVEVLEKRDFTAAERDKAADKGQAMPGGGFPIKTKQDLKNAIAAFGRAKDKAAAKKHIISRARALGAVDMLPADWGVSKALGIVDQVRTLVPGVELTKATDTAADGESGDAMGGQEAIAAIARLIISEAESLAEGNYNELWDIQILLDAACALRCFVGNEMREDTMAEAAKTEDATTGDTGTVVDKTETESDTGVALSELVTKAITEATKPLIDELTLVKAELAQVKATPIPGGPARVRTAGHTAVAAKADDIRRDIDQLRKSVDATQDRALREGYQTRLAARETDLAKLTS
jgi:hypothetical protein